MSEDAIVRKLGEHLDCGVDTECKVVYLLCEIRKLMDKPPRDTGRFFLRLYCDWAVHVELTHATTTEVFLERVDRFAINKLSGIETREAIVAEDTLLRDFVYLETFRKDLKTFLVDKDLPTMICDDDGAWFTFLTAYAGVIEDGSLSCESRSGLDKLKIVKKVTFSKGPQTIEDSHVPFGIQWEILLKNGKQLQVEVATQTEEKFLSATVRYV